MLDEVAQERITIPGINAPAVDKGGSIKELGRVAEEERQAMIGKAFEKFLQAGYGVRGDFIGMLASSVDLSDALKLMRIDGKEITPDMLDNIMFNLTRMQLDSLTPSRNEFTKMRAGWRDYSGKRTMLVDFGKPNKSASDKPMERNIVELAPAAQTGPAKV